MSVGKCTIIHEDSPIGTREMVIPWDIGLGTPPSYVKTLAALNGNSSPQTDSAVLIVQRTSGTGNLVLKGQSGDTGIPLRPGDPTVFAPTSSYVINTTASSDVTIVKA